VYIGYSKILPHSLTRRVPKLRIGGLHKKKAPTEAGANERNSFKAAFSEAFLATHLTMSARPSGAVSLLDR